MKPIRIQKNVRFIHSREESSIDLYFRDIYGIKLLTPEEEVILARKIQAGIAKNSSKEEKEISKKALNKLVESNLRFVVSVAKQYQNKGALLLDLINEGNIGLIKAAETFDETKGVRFISYAVYWIKQAILSALTEQNHMIHIPFNQFYLTSRIKKIVDENKAKGKNVSEEEIASLLNIDLEDVQDSLNQTLGYTISLDSKISSEEDTDKATLIDVVENKNIKAPDSQLLEESKRKDILAFLRRVLDEREFKVIIMNYGIGFDSPMSFQEVADRLGLTKECIRQIKEKAITKLRLHGGNICLKQYL